MSITAKLVGTPQSNATLLLNGDELTSGGTLLASATIPSDLFKQLLSFASMNQEVRVVIDMETESGTVKKYDYINEVFTDANGNTGVKLEKTGLVLYEDGASAPAGGADQSLSSNKDFVDYNGAYRLCGYYDPHSGVYKITYGVNSPVNTIVFLGMYTNSLERKQQFLIGAGYANSNIGNNRYFKLGYCYSNASKGDAYSYAADGLLTLDNAPNFYRDTDTSKRFGLPFATAATSKDIGNDGYEGEIFDFRPFVEVYEEDGTLVSITMGEQFHGEYDVDYVLTSSTMYDEYDLVSDPDALPNRNDIIKMYLSTYGRRNGAFNYLDLLRAGKRTFLTNYNYSDYVANHLACEDVYPSELEHDTYGIVALGLTLKTVSGNRVDADFFLDPNILSVDDYVVHLTPTAEDLSGTMDKTPQEITSAIAAGRRIVFDISSFNARVVPDQFLNLGDNTVACAKIAYEISNVPVLISVATSGTDDDESYGASIYQLTPLS